MRFGGLTAPNQRADERPLIESPMSPARRVPAIAALVRPYAVPGRSADSNGPLMAGADRRYRSAPCADISDRGLMQSAQRWVISQMGHDSLTASGIISAAAIQPNYQELLGHLHFKSYPVWE
jgi:hypothetical protein